MLLKKTRTVPVFLLLAFALYAREEKDLRLFIKTPEVKAGVSAQFAADFAKKLSLHFFEAGGYRVLDENDIKVIYQEAEQLLVLGCDAEQCLMQIAHAVNAEEVVYGTIEKPADKIKLFLQLLKKEKDSDKMSKKSVVEVSFYESQTDWYSDEVVKKLINPAYIIDSSKAPVEVKITVKLEPIALKEIRQEDIKAITFKTDDDSVNMIVDVLRDILVLGDTLVNKKDYPSGLTKYEEAIFKIETKVTKSKQVKLATLKKDIFGKMSDTYKMIYSRDIKKADEYINTGQYEDANATYWSVLEKIRELRKEITDLMKPFIAQIKERKNIAKENIVKLQIKEADQYYNEFRFREAAVLYEKAREGIKDIYSPLIKGDKGVVRKDLESSIVKKIEIARNTEKEYLKNKVRAYCDKIEVYNIRDNSESANKTFNDLAGFIKENPGCEKYPEVAASYKEIAEVLNVTITIEAGDMVYISAGEFLMGSDSGESDEKPVHKVYLDAYYIDKYEVTNKQYAKFLNEYGRDTDDSGQKMIYEDDWGIIKVAAGFTPAPGYEEYPVVYVTWYGANQYAKWAKKRLPTEAEWEKAARAGSNTKYCFGDDNSGLDNYAW